MARVPAPSPRHTQAGRARLRDADKEAEAELERAVERAGILLNRWREHQAGCEPCAELPDADYGGPGCRDGWKTWCKWKNVQEHADWLGQLLDPEPPPDAGEARTDSLRLF